MENKKTKNVLLAIMGVLILVELVAGFMTMSIDGLFRDIIKLISIVFVVLYGFWLYKKPHGNMLKYAMIILALASILASSKSLMAGKAYHIIKILASAALCYCAGRLSRIDQNKYIMPIIGIAFLIVSICAARKRIINQTESIWMILYCFSFTINYLALMLAYFVRFDEHKEAGLMDAPSK